MKEDCERMEKPGVTIVVKSFDGQAFSHPKTSKGIIYEIVEL